jgi:NitT/TauT family transport system permease protein
VASALGQWLTGSSLRHDILVTLEESALGLLLALLIAIVLAIPLASSRRIADFANPFVAVVNAIPKIALAPLFLLVFGLGLRSKVYFIAAAVFFLPFYSLFRSLTTVDRAYLETVQVLGGNRAWRIRDVYLPAMVAATITSLRITVAFSLLSAVVAELVSSSEGIGYEIQQAQNNLQPNYIISGVLVVAVLVYVSDLILRFVERRTLAWRVGQT